MNIYIEQLGNSYKSFAEYNFYVVLDTSHHNLEPAKNYLHNGLEAKQKSSRTEYKKIKTK